MLHTCPECRDDDNPETHLCQQCGDTYCVHFMRMADHKSICWVCGSDKNKEDKMAEFRLWKSRENEQFYFNLEAGDAKITSEGYTEKSSAENGIASVKENAANDERYERKTASDGKHYFVIKAANGEEIAKSTKFRDNTDELEKDIVAIKKEAPKAPTIET